MKEKEPMTQTGELISFYKLFLKSVVEYANMWASWVGMDTVARHWRRTKKEIKAWRIRFVAKCYFQEPWAGRNRRNVVVQEGPMRLFLLYCTVSCIGAAISSNHKVIMEVQKTHQRLTSKVVVDLYGKIADEVIINIC